MNARSWLAAYRRPSRLTAVSAELALLRDDLAVTVPILREIAHVCTLAYRSESLRVPGPLSEAEARLSALEDRLAGHETAWAIIGAARAGEAPPPPPRHLTLAWDAGRKESTP